MIRTPTEIKSQIAEFKTFLPTNYEPPQEDFAACLQWESWQGHLQDLEDELKVSQDQLTKTPPR